MLYPEGLTEFACDQGLIFTISNSEMSHSCVVERLSCDLQTLVNIDCLWLLAGRTSD